MPKLPLLGSHCNGEMPLVIMEGHGFIWVIFFSWTSALVGMKSDRFWPGNHLLQASKVSRARGGSRKRGPGPPARDPGPAPAPTEQQPLLQLEAAPLEAAAPSPPGGPAPEPVADSAAPPAEPRDCAGGAGAGALPPSRRNASRGAAAANGEARWAWRPPLLSERREAAAGRAAERAAAAAPGGQRCARAAGTGGDSARALAGGRRQPPAAPGAPRGA